MKSLQDIAPWLWTLRGRIIMNVVLLHVALVSIIVYDFVGRQRDFMIQEIEEQGRIVAATLAANAPTWLLTNDLVAMKELVETIRTVPNIRTVMIIDRQGIVKASMDDRLFNLVLDDPESRNLLETMANNPERRVIQIVHHGIVDTLAEVRIKHDRIGFVRIILDNSSAYAEVRAAVEKGILYVALAVVLGGILAWLTVRTLTSRLDRLVKVSDEISSGNLDVAIHQEYRNDEIDRLTAAFRTMVTSLKNTIVNLREREETLAAEKERLAVTFFFIGDGVVATDADGIVELMNRSAMEITGWADGEAVGKNLKDVLAFYDDVSGEPFVDLLDEVRRMHSVTIIWQASLRNRNDDAEHLIAYSIAPISDTEGRIAGFVLVFRDVTERRRMQNELNKVQKLESLGLLAGGIAHDFNNLLTGILGNLSLARNEIPSVVKVIRRLDDAEKASLQARDLARQLLTFSRGGDPLKKPVAIGQIIKDAASFSLHGSSVKCELFLDDSLNPVDGDEGQITQVINNLVINAEQSMPKGGTISVHAHNFSVRSAHGLPVKEGDYVRIEVKDEGCGISSANLQKIFDPFFTTKPTGTGLGLATSFSIVKRHEGHIGVISKEGAGSVFTIFLPIAGSQPLPKQTEKQSSVMGSGKILVMDDEEIVRNVCFEMLTMLGYTVTLSCDGKEAVVHYREAMDNGNPFDALIVDITVPGGMGGEEVLRHIQEFDSSVRAIVSSGYAHNPVIAHYAQYGFAGVIVKPFLIADLDRTVRSVLAKQENPVAEGI